MSGEKRAATADEVSDPDRVMRSFWMKGSFSAEEKVDTSLLVTVHYREDVDESWKAVYVDTHVRFYLAAPSSCLSHSGSHCGSGSPANEDGVVCGRDEVMKFDGLDFKEEKSGDDNESPLRLLREDECARFDEWVYRNFDENSEIQSKNYIEGTVVIKVKNQTSSTSTPPTVGPQQDIEAGPSTTTTTTSSDRQKAPTLPTNTMCPVFIPSFPIFQRGESQVHPDSDLLNWARTNLRMFEWDKFEPDLLYTSPREIKDIQEKERLYSLSTALSWEDLQFGHRKIDFFVSHSWDDCPQDKSLALTKFAARFEAQYGRKPTFWLDKVCIDQKDTSRGVAALPINIGACRKMLVLMSKSYMKRLWCVWELFSIFTFCNKELALERIHILPVRTKLPDDDGRFDIPGELRSFDINKAHCFGPNEEFKLRAILHEIGVHRFRSCMSALALTYERKKLEERRINLMLSLGTC